MPIDRVVLDASPLICFFKSGLDDLLPAMFQEIVVSADVMSEVTAEGKADFATEKIRSSRWIHQMADLPIDPRVASWDLGKGESSVLSFVLRNPDRLDLLCLVILTRWTRQTR